jgi:hypothetical protein
VPRPYRRALAVAIAVAALLAAIGSSPATAGTYTVRQCDHAGGNGHHDFHWQTAGSPAPIAYPGSGCGEFGLAARNASPGAEPTYPSGAYGGWFAYAPPGTAITRFAGSFGTLAACCINGLATYAEATERADGTGARSYLFQGNLGNNSWYAPSGLQGPIGRGWDATTSGFAAQRVGFHLRCGPGFSCRQGSSGDLRLRARSFDFTLRDDVRPTVAAPTGTLLSGGWLRGTRALSFSAADVGAGLTTVTANFDNGTTLAAPSACTTVGGRFARLRPCPLGRSGSWAVDTAKLPDGLRTVTVRAADAGGATGEQVRTVRVDNTPPASPSGATVAGGSGWRRSNGFVVRWANPARQHAPIAIARYRACRVGGAQCVIGERRGEGVTASDAILLPRAGEWDLRVWLEDAAGNADPAASAGPLRLRFDPDPPQPRFLPFDAAAPARVAVVVTDLSGLAAGEIELRRRGGTTWRTLPTTRQGARLVAAIDDARLPRGAYELRVRAVDAAGNHAVALGPVRTLPLQAPTRLRAVALRRVFRARLGCRPARARACRARVTVRRSVVRTRHRSTVAIRGGLATTSGRALAGRAVGVELISRDRTVSLPAARTDAAGRIALLVPARRSALVRLRFAGDDGALPSSRQLAIHVPAPVRVRADRRMVGGGRRVTLRGRILGGAIPRRGKLVEVQAHFRGRWRTISAVRSTRGGRWRFAYAFQATGRRATYALRARVPIEAGYPFAAGASRPVRVTVRPR